MKKSDNSQSQLFATRLGVIAATVGSAVGLGNIWRFPYEAGVHGGGAFMIVYLVFIFLLGIPVLTAEFVLGRSTHRSVFGAFGFLKPGTRFKGIGLIGVVASLMILSFYSVVAGWTLEYFIRSFGDLFSKNGSDDFHRMFGEFTEGWRPILWTVVFLLINMLVIVRGVQKGVERASNIITPLLFVLILIFCVNSLTLSGAREGLEFLFRPDFSEISPSVVIGAMGQAFFSLSLGLGCMLTYASYFKDDTPLIRSATVTAGLDVMAAILSGILIFPAVFTYGFSPEAGPALVFEVLPAIFAQMPGGKIFAPLFFFMLFLASLSSTISMSEIMVSWLTRERGVSRRSACWLTIGIAMFFGVLCALSFSYMSGLKIAGTIEFNIFNIFDYTSSNILLPFGGMLISIFTGWQLDRNIVKKTMNEPKSWFNRFAPFVIFILKYVAPVMIFVIFVSNV
ncbi:MAG: sodium-dependent transporter [Muribaculaceae bacterium]|nr:sodium-dependent transporter [Muribaculaceae bacterium]